MKNIRKNVLVILIVIFSLCIRTNAEIPDIEKVSAASVLIASPSFVGYMFAATPIAICPIANVLPIFISAEGGAPTAEDLYFDYLDKQCLKHNKKKIKEFSKNQIFDEFKECPKANKQFVSRYNISSSENIDAKIKMADFLNNRFSDSDDINIKNGVVEQILKSVNTYNYDFLTKLLSDKDYSIKDFESIISELNIVYGDENIKLIGIEGLENRKYKEYRTTVYKYNRYGDFKDRYNAFLKLKEAGFSNEYIENLVKNDSNAVMFINEYGIEPIRNGSYEQYKALRDDNGAFNLQYVKAYKLFLNLKRMGYTDSEIKTFLKNEYVKAHIRYIDFNHFDNNYAKYLLSVKWKNNWSGNQELFDKRYKIYTELKENQFSEKEILKIINDDNTVVHYDIIGIDGFKNGNFNKFKRLYEIPCYSNETYILYLMLNNAGFSDDNISKIINKNGIYDKNSISEIIANSNLTEEQKTKKIIKGIKKEKEYKSNENDSLTGFKLYTAGVGATYKLAYDYWYEKVKFKNYLRQIKKYSK